MKRALLAAAILACLFFITGCTPYSRVQGNPDDHIDNTIATTTSTVTPDQTQPTTQPEAPDTTNVDSIPPDEPSVPTLARLSATITSAGQFWEDWWAFEGLFTYTEGYGIFVPTDPNQPGTGMSFSPLLPASGFTTLDDVHNHLTQFYSAHLAESEMAHNFIMYDGQLYFANARAGFPRFDWTDATFEIISESDGFALVEATVRHGYFILDPGGYVTLHFYMVDGRIDYVSGGSIVMATLDWWGGDGASDYEVWDTFTAELANGWLYVATATETLLGSFIDFHTVNYNHLHGADREPFGDRLVIWSSMPLFDLELIGVTTEMIGDDLVYIPLNAYGRIDALWPGYGYIVANYMSMGTLPWSGITFLDETGARYHFWLNHDNSDSTNRFFLGQFIDRSDELPDDWEAYWR